MKRALVFLAIAACSSEAATSGVSGPSTTHVDGGADAGGTPDGGPKDAGTDSGVDAGPQYKTCTDAELAAAVLSTNGADISFTGAGVDGGAYVYTNNCVRIPQGKDVGWYGDFQMHPLENDGEPGSPIPLVSTGSDSGRIVFPNKGRFSFHCQVHPSTMYGTVQVE